VFGWAFATIQDQERYYQEAYEIIIKAWTQSSFSHHGQFFTIPPVFTRWNHKQTIAYFKMPKAGRRLEDVVQLGGPPIRRSEPGHADRNAVAGTAGFPATAPEAPPPGMGAAHDRALDSMGRAARRQRLFHRRTDLATAAQYRHLL